MKSVTFTSNDQQKLDLLTQLAKEIGVQVVRHYDSAADDNTDAVNEANEPYTKTLVDVSEEKRGKNGDYHLPGPPPSNEDLEAWLDDSEDGQGVEFTAEEFINYIQKKREEKRKWWKYPFRPLPKNK